MNFPENVKARFLTMHATATANSDKASVLFAPHTARISREVNQILHSHRNASAKFYALWEVYNEMSAFHQPYSACKVGCSHCCHIAVAMTVAEAEAVGKRIGRTPKKPKLVNNFRDFDFGYHNPCTFLIDNRCSIYQHRPTACRTCYNMDEDSLLCQFDDHDKPGDGSRPVPYLDQTEIQKIALYIAQPREMNCLADIRAFFPRREK